MNLDEIFVSYTRRAIVLFFHKNQSSIDTAKGISTWIDSDFADVQKALEELVKSGILLAHRTSSTIGYAYTQNKHVIAIIENYLQTHKI